MDHDHDFEGAVIFAWITMADFLVLCSWPGGGFHSLIDQSIMRYSSSSYYLAFFTIMGFLLQIVEAMGGDDNILPFKKRKLIHSFADLSNNVNKSEMIEQPSTDQQMGNQNQGQNKASASMSAHEKGTGIASHHVMEMNEAAQLNDVEEKDAQDNDASLLWPTESKMELERYTRFSSKAYTQFLRTGPLPSTDQMGNQSQGQNKASASMSAHEKGKGIASHPVMGMNEAAQPNSSKNGAVEEVRENDASLLSQTGSTKELKRTVSGKLDAKAFFEPTSNSNGEIQKETALRWGALNYFNHIDKITEHSPRGKKKIIQISGPDEKEITENTNATKLHKNSAKGRRYLTEFKLKVVKYANESNVTVACRKFKLHRSIVYRWIEIYGASLSFEKKGQGRLMRKILKTGSPSLGPEESSKKSTVMENPSEDSSEPDV